MGSRSSKIETIIEDEIEEEEIVEEDSMEYEENQGPKVQLESHYWIKTKKKRIKKI